MSSTGESRRRPASRRSSSSTAWPRRPGRGHRWRGGVGARVAAWPAGVQPGAVAGLGLVDGGWEELEATTRMDAAEFLRGLAEPPEVLRSMDAYLADRREGDG